MEDGVGLEQLHAAHAGRVARLKHAVAGGDGVEIAQDQARAGRGGGVAQQLAHGLGAAHLEGQQQVGQQVHAVDRQRAAAGQLEGGFERGLGERRGVVDVPGADGEARQQRDVAVAAAAGPGVVQAQPFTQLDHHRLVIGLGERGHIRR